MLVCAIVWVGGCAYVIAHTPHYARTTARVTAIAAQLPATSNRGPTVR